MAITRKLKYRFRPNRPCLCFLDWRPIIDVRCPPDWLGSDQVFPTYHSPQWHPRNSLQSYLWNSSVKSSNSFPSQTVKRSLWHHGSYEVRPYTSYLDIYNIHIHHILLQVRKIHQAGKDVKAAIKFACLF